MRHLPILLALVCLTSCSSEEQTAADKIKTVVAAKMKDPDSAKFSGLRLNGTVLCGEVNAKNSFGAYAGADQFWATSTFVDTKSEAANRDRVLAESPAAERWKQSVTEFDKAWQKCRAKGVFVE